MWGDHGSEIKASFATGILRGGCIPWEYLENDFVTFDVTVGWLNRKVVEMLDFDRDLQTKPGRNME